MTAASTVAVPETVRGWLLPLALVGFLAPTLAERGLQWQGRGLRRLGQVLVDLGLVTDDIIAKALAAQLDLPWVDVLAQPIDPPLLWKVPRKVAEMHDLFAFGRDETGAVKIALADPLSDAALRDVELLLGKRARVFVSSSTTIQKAIARHYDLEPQARRMLEVAHRRDGSAWFPRYQLGVLDALVASRQTALDPVDDTPSAQAVFCIDDRCESFRRALEEIAAEQAAAKTTNVAPFTRKRPSRQPFPDHLPRERVVVPAPTTCDCCGGTRLRKLGETITETLEVIPRSGRSSSTSARR